ncbi:RluA family pseudouridine synthase [Paenibacillus spiritus]|uniref:Pseudouridine synthase n=1 Tax=Paenibacillus spiritus TaxID=2496557 RepID=A0A5J5GBC8_9BACL|nr:RluA family pseudouridine synthase [Paenibacillus spiritus]KAA9005328.1 RluA family pseudouridine synthase [Paenibacillus spiritus]
MDNSYYDPIVYTIPEADDGLTLKTVLHKRMNISRKLLSRLKLTERGIMLNGERVYISVSVKTGDVVELRMETETSDDIMPQPIPFDILYEDDHLLVVNKPAGLIVHPTHGHYTDTLANGVVHYWAERGQRYRFRPVHRLDQETSGVLAIAKNPYSHQQISEQMLAGTVDKSYLAFVHGTALPDAGELDGPIDRDPLEPHRRIVTPDGYPSLTRYAVRERFAAGAAVELTLLTGRTHQIRVHLSAAGAPLIGDRMYRHPCYGRPERAALPAAGGAASAAAAEAAAEGAAPEAHGGEAGDCAAVRALDAAIGRQALHAARLALTHPALGSRMVFEAPLPPDMAALEARLSGREKDAGDDRRP